MDRKLRRARAISMIGCLVAPFCAGIVYLWSVFKADTMSYYGWEEGSVNLIASFMLFGFCLGNTIGGNIQDRTHPRLTATIGICLFGCGLLFVKYKRQNRKYSGVRHEIIRNTFSKLVTLFRRNGIKAQIKETATDKSAVYTITVHN